MNPTFSLLKAHDRYDDIRSSPSELIVALAGNPNVGKSTLFNAMTGLRQHTGNWAGKTVETARGEAVYAGRRLIFADLPGCYSLYNDRAEESAAASFLRAKKADAAVVVCDGVTARRGLLLFFQVKQICPKTVLCVNLIDEADRRGIAVDREALARLTGSPVVCTSARQKTGVDELLKTVLDLADGRIVPHAPALDTQDCDRLAKETAARCFTKKGDTYTARDRRLDRLLTGKYTAIPCMLLLLTLIFWITIRGANLPSELLSALFTGLEPHLSAGLRALRLPEAAVSLLTEGVYRTVSWVVAVMLPPMAIFFPLFTLAEDAGLLPRIAFNLDRPFARCSACGKQALTMCMGFGCNAVGVTGCRIIESPRERMLAILTNNFMPCNGRFPFLIAMITVFLCANGGGLLSALCLTALILLGVLLTFGVSGLLSATCLKGKSSFFALEMPMFRRPKLRETIVRSILDRTLFVLGRAVTTAVPAGLLLWLSANIYAGDRNLLQHLADFLEPLGRLLGLDGEILIGFLFALPANEIVLPIILMAYSGAGALAAVPGYETLHQILTAQGWTVLTALNASLFSLFHWPCATTLKTIYRETKSKKTTAAAFLLPTGCGILLCLLTTWLFRLFS